MTALSWADAGVLVLSLIIARLLGDWVMNLIRGRENGAQPPEREGQADALVERADQPNGRELQLGFQRLSIDYDEDDRGIGQRPARVRVEPTMMPPGTRPQAPRR